VYTYLKSRIDFDAGGSKVSFSGTSEESAGAGAYNGTGNGTDSRRGIFLESVTRRCGEKYRTLIEHDICKHKIFSNKNYNTDIPFEF